ncbi:hypothetical protein [Cupriavidus lacunae]|uniref:hypothetical protein n=1 Tax=Cupriavidus lacunae TaxID=2666307 RepID=UPI001058C114|nr:hypothetical protein [Cupriavidus lacunae]
MYTGASASGTFTKQAPPAIGVPLASTVDESDCQRRSTARALECLKLKYAAFLQIQLPGSFPTMYFSHSALDVPIL